MLVMSSTDRAADGSSGANGPTSPESPSGPSIGGYHFDVNPESDSAWKRWTATEQITGQEASGPSWVLTLIILIILVALNSDSDDTLPADDDADPEEVWKEVTAESKRRFDEEDITDSDIEDAIRWARSQ